jgi:hypothetical protein
MLKRKIESDGTEVWLRKPYRAEDYTPTPAQLGVFSNLAGISIREIMAMPERPLGSYWEERIELDGKTYWRFSHMTEEWAVLIEDSDERIAARGGITIIPPEEAYAIARSYDARRGRPVIEQS